MAVVVLERLRYQDFDTKPDTELNSRNRGLKCVGRIGEQYLVGRALTLSPRRTCIPAKLALGSNPISAFFASTAARKDSLGRNMYSCSCPFHRSTGPGTATPLQLNLSVSE